MVSCSRSPSTLKRVLLLLLSFSNGVDMLCNPFNKELYADDDDDDDSDTLLDSDDVNDDDNDDIIGVFLTYNGGMEFIDSLGLTWSLSDYNDDDDDDNDNVMINIIVIVIT